MTEAVCHSCGAGFIVKRHTVGKFCSRACSNVGPRTKRHPDRKGGRQSWVDHEIRHTGILAALQGGPQRTTALAETIACSPQTTKAECMVLAAAGAIRVVRFAHFKGWALPTWTRAPKPAPPVRSPRPAVERQGLRQPAPPAPTVDIEPSWWVGASREALQTGAREREQAMRSSKENRHVPFRTLQ